MRSCFSWSKLKEQHCRFKRRLEACSVEFLVITYAKWSPIILHSRVLKFDIDHIYSPNITICGETTGCCCCYTCWISGGNGCFSRVSSCLEYFVAFRQPQATIVISGDHQAIDMVIEMICVHHVDSIWIGINSGVRAWRCLPCPHFYQFFSKFGYHWTKSASTVSKCSTYVDVWIHLNKRLGSVL